MINTETVNAEAVCDFYVHFHEFFLFFAQFLRFKISVKYTRSLRINLKDRPESPFMAFVPPLFFS